MKKTAWIDSLRNIKKRLVSWLSMVTIVLIGTSVILGLYFSYSALENCGNNYIKEHGFKDIDIACTIGIKEEEIDKFLAVDGVKDAEGIISFPGQLSVGANNAGATLISITDRISVPYIIEGDMPSSENECAINAELAKILNASIGDEVSINVSTARLANILKNEKYVITGIAGHPDYMNKGKVEFCILPKASFDTSKSAFDYTNVAVRIDASEIYKHTEKKHETEVTKVRAAIEDILQPMSDERIRTLVADLDEEYQKAEDEVNKKLSEGKSEIDSAQKEFDEKIGEAKKKIDDAEKELTEGKEKADRELASAWKKIQDGEKEYNEKIADGEKQLADGEKQMEKELQDAKWKLFSGFLEIDANEKLLNSKEEEYQNGCIDYGIGETQLKKARAELDNGWSQYNSGAAKIDSNLTPDLVKSVAGGLAKVGKDDIADELYAIADKDALERAEGVIAVYDKYVIDEVKNLIEKVSAVSDFRSNIGQLRSGKNTLDSGEAAYKDGQKQLEDARWMIDDARKQLDQGWFALEQAKKQLAEGEAEFAKKEPEARAQLAAKKAEFEEKKAEGAKELEDAKKLYASEKKKVLDEIESHEKELEEGKEKFESEKADGEAKLKDAREQFESAKKDAMDLLADVKEQIENGKKTECKWFVQTPDANIHFMEFKSYCDILIKVCYVFTPIYASIVIIVCFFTMAIIVEEQAKQIGTCKALGMYKSEVRNKYLLFGATASVFGALLGIGGAFCFEHIIGNSLATTFVFGYPPHKMEILPLVILPVGAVFVTSIAVMTSSQKVLSCSAIGLTSGNEPANKARQKASKNTHRSVYTSLIFNNFFMDLGRETVSVVIIFVCCMLIGLGITIKLGHAGAMNNQVKNIHEYDINLTMTETATDEEKEKILDAIKDYDKIGVYKVGGIIQTEDGQTLTEIYCTDDYSRFKEFYSLKDSTGRDIDLSSSGLAVSIEMGEKNGLYDGKEVVLITSTLKMTDATINGHFLLHVGKAAVMSFEYYEQIFGEAPVINDYMIKVSEGNLNEIEEKLLTYPGVSEVSKAIDLLEDKAGMSRLYSIVVVIVIAFSIMLSFMILLNLSNILIAHRMKELLTMRVNGFSNGQVIGYLVRELLVTTSLGILLGLLIGIPVTTFIIHNIESDGFMFLRKVYVVAWLAAVSCNVVFSLIINSVAFRKIGKVPLTDITKY